MKSPLATMDDVSTAFFAGYIHMLHSMLMSTDSTVRLDLGQETGVIIYKFKKSQTDIKDRLTVLANKFLLEHEQPQFVMTQDTRPDPELVSHDPDPRPNPFHEWCKLKGYDPKWAIEIANKHRNTGATPPVMKLLNGQWVELSTHDSELAKAS